MQKRCKNDGKSTSTLIVLNRAIEFYPQKLLSILIFVFFGSEIYFALNFSACAKYGQPCTKFRFSAWTKI